MRIKSMFYMAFDMITTPLIYQLNTRIKKKIIHIFFKKMSKDVNIK